MLMQRTHLIITGNVQGVGFRWFVQRTARQLGIKGWVQNKEDGSVEAVAEGMQESITLFIEACKKGHAYGNVENVLVDEEKAGGGFADFEIR